MGNVVIRVAMIEGGGGADGQFQEDSGIRLPTLSQ